MLNLAQLLQRRTAFNQRPATCRCRQTGGDRRWRGDHQRARAANQQQGQTFINPALPERAKEQRWNERNQQSNQHNGGRVNPAKAIDKTLDGGTTLFSFFNQLQDTVDGAVAGPGKHLKLHQAVNAGGACRHFFSRGTLNRNGFPCQGAFIKACGGAKQCAIGRQAPPCGDFNDVARAQRADGDGFTFAFVNPRRGFRLQCH